MAPSTRSMARAAEATEEALGSMQVTIKQAEQAQDGRHHLMTRIMAGEKRKLDDLDNSEANVAKKPRADDRSPALIKTSEVSLLRSLPIDIVLTLFDQLDPTASTCLGLTCRVLYSIHRQRHGTVCLTTKVSLGDAETSLAQLLESFFPSRGFCDCEKKYLTEERFFMVIMKKLEELSKTNQRLGEQALRLHDQLRQL